MSKGERISRLVTELVGKDADVAFIEVEKHSFYRAFFRCWNEQRYYEAHDVLEQLWLKTDSSDADFFKGLIQAAGAFVHLQKNFEQPSHTKHGRRLRPATRLFSLALRNLEDFPDEYHALDLVQFRKLLLRYRDVIIAVDFKNNPWSPETAPRLALV
jgi:predicted metal-dependent hydrolase